MQGIEQRPNKELFTIDNPRDGELLEIFVVAAGGSFPFAVTTFSEGLRAAAEKFPPLGIFVDPKGINYLSRRFDDAFYGASLHILNNERWGIPSSYPRINQIKSKMEMMLTPQGKKALGEAAVAANKVWSERAI